MLWPLLLVHICGAVVGLLSGFLALSLRKGSGWHGAAGTMFFGAMLTMSATAAYIAAFLRPNALNVVVGLLTLYLVSTAWSAAKRRDGQTGIFDMGALLFALAVGVSGVSIGFEAANSARGTKDGIPAALYLIFGSVALLCAVSDSRMLVRRGLFGMQRIARHLWRMCLALLIATLSFFPGQAKLFPMSLRETGLLYVPHVVLIGSMIFWMYRVKVRKRVRHEALTVANAGDAIVRAGAATPA